MYMKGGVRTPRSSRTPGPAIGGSPFESPPECSYAQCGRILSHVVWLVGKGHYEYIHSVLRIRIFFFVLLVANVYVVSI